jgi:quercetin dioxygenase-like cupin family protein
VTSVARANEVEDASSGQRWVFHDTGGDVLEADLYVSPGGFVREHAHPTQAEIFDCLSGTFVLDVDGMKRTLGPGASIVIPPGTPHGFSDAPEPAHLRVTVRPALRLEHYFRVFLGLSRDGRIRMPVKGLPSPLLSVAIVMDRFAPEIAAPRVPARVQRLAWRALALAGRLRGYPSSFPEYGVP